MVKDSSASKNQNEVGRFLQSQQSDIVESADYYRLGTPGQNRVIHEIIDSDEAQMAIDESRMLKVIKMVEVA